MTKFSKAEVVGGCSLFTLLVIVIFLLVNAGIAFLFMLGWNLIAPAFGLATISYTVAFGITLIGSAIRMILTGMFSNK